MSEMRYFPEVYDPSLWTPIAERLVGVDYLEAPILLECDCSIIFNWRKGLYVPTASQVNETGKRNCLELIWLKDCLTLLWKKCKSKVFKGADSMQD